MQSDSLIYTIVAVLVLAFRLRQPSPAPAFHP